VVVLVVGLVQLDLKVAQLLLHSLELQRYLLAVEQVVLPQPLIVVDLADLVGEQDMVVLLVLPLEHQVILVD